MCWVFEGRRWLEEGGKDGQGEGKAELTRRGVRKVLPEGAGTGFERNYTFLYFNS